ncbi:MAG: hypothetical protein AVDCRST_MAG83-486, partial [uncultured Arthrobacter sp.]
DTDSHRYGGRGSSRLRRPRLWILGLPADGPADGGRGAAGTQRRRQARLPRRPGCPHRAPIVFV